MLKPLLLSLSLLSTYSCGVSHRASGSVDTSGNQSVVVDVTFRIDISGCFYLPEQDRLDCVKTVAESLKEIASVAEVLLCARDLEASPISEGADTPESCRRLTTPQGGAGNPEG